MAKCLLALGRKSGEIGKAKLPAELILDWMLEGKMELNLCCALLDTQQLYDF